MVPKSVTQRWFNKKIYETNLIAVPEYQMFLCYGLLNVLNFALISPKLSFKNVLIKQNKLDYRYINIFLFSLSLRGTNLKKSIYTFKLHCTWHWELENDLSCMDNNFVYNCLNTKQSTILQWNTYL